MNPKDQSPSEGVSDEFVERVEQAVGMGHTAWDMVDPKEIIAAALSERTKGEADHWRVGDKEGGYSYYNTKAEASSHGTPVALYTHPPAADVRGDWVLVPRVPTRPMIEEGELVGSRPTDVWAAMIAAAPKPEGV